MSNQPDVRTNLIGHIALWYIVRVYSPIINPYPAKFKKNHPLGVVQLRDPQLQVAENYSFIRLI